jgi:hypothetical protein
VRGDGGGDLFHEALLVKLHGGQVDRDRNGNACVLPDGRLPCCSIERPFPIGTISPRSSASGMNLPGGTSPTPGRSQRINASAPMISPDRISISG